MDYVTMTLTAFDKQSNGRRMEIESVVVTTAFRLLENRPSAWLAADVDAAHDGCIARVIDGVERVSE